MFEQFIKYFTDSKLRFILLGASFWCVGQVFFLSHFGVKCVNDTPRYLEYAQQILNNGFYWDTHNKWYLGYVLFLMPFVGFHLSIEAIVGVQIVLSLAVFVLFLNEIYQYKNKWILLLLSLLWFKVWQWNCYVMTESLFVSMVFLGVYLFWYYPKKWYTALCFLVLFWVRPTGFFFLVAYGVGYITLLPFPTKYKFWLGGLLGVMALGLVNKMLVTFDLISVFSRGELVFAVGTLENPPYPTWLIIKPESVVMPIKTAYPLWDVVHYVILNLGHFIKISFGKAFYFLLHVKPYFHWAHNVLVLMVLLPMYRNLFQFFRERWDAKQVFLMSIWIGHVVMVIAATEDWDGRFLLPLVLMSLAFGKAKKNVTHLNLTDKIEKF